VEEYDVISVEQLTDLLTDPEALERPVTDGESPLVVVDLTPVKDGRADVLPAGSAAPQRVLVGWSEGAFDSPGLVPFDVLLSADDDRPFAGWIRCREPATSIEKIAATCRTAPRAATTLVQLLRLRRHLPVGDALVAESLAYSMLLAGPEFSRWLQTQGLPAARPSSEPVVVDDDGTTVTITLNRPEVRNAYDAAMRDRLVDILRGLLASPSHPPTVLRGKGPAFSSGGDLAEFGTAEDPVTAHSIRVSRSPGRLLDALGDVTAVVQGPCVGAGVELPAFCRRVVARPDASFRLPEVGMGLVPGAGGTVSLPPRIGRQRAAFLALTGDALPVETALKWHLVDEVVDHG
jgi:hypothetical protein